MSATLDSTIFQEYYAKVARSADISTTYRIPVTKCEFNCFEVELFYLEQIKQILNLNQVKILKNNKK